MEFKKTSKQGGRRLALDITLRSDSTNTPKPQTRNPGPLVGSVESTKAESRNPPEKKGSAVSIDLTFLSRLSKILFNKKTIVAASVIVAAILAGSNLLGTKKSEDSSAASNTSSNRPVGNPQYQTVLPEGKSIDELGDWKRVSPPEGDPVYAYIDKIDEVTISVSQQPIPKSLKGNADEQIAELAKKFNATSRIDADGTKVYVGSSSKGPQSAILTKNNLLILIKSQEKVADTSWAKYAKSLK